LLNLLYGPALPQNRYEMVQLIYPENYGEISDPIAQAPHLIQLKQTKLHWVIWNSFFYNWIQSIEGDQQIEIYKSQWRRFYDDIKSGSDPVRHIFIPGGLSPDIEIFYIP
jgi:hypothetical protein